MSDNLYTNHHPEILPVHGSDGTTKWVYHKTERDDNFYFRKTRSITINCALLDQGIQYVNKNSIVPDGVRISIPHRNVQIKATREAIRQAKIIKTFKGESKYHLPVLNWIVEHGDSNWVAKLFDDEANNRLKQ